MYKNKTGDKIESSATVNNSHLLFYFFFHMQIAMKNTYIKSRKC